MGEWVWNSWADNNTIEGLSNRLEEKWVYSQVYLWVLCAAIVYERGQI